METLVSSHEVSIASVRRDRLGVRHIDLLVLQTRLERGHSDFIKYKSNPEVIFEVDLENT